VSDFGDVASERGQDATVLRREGRRLAAVYMVGYVVECRLKDYLRRRRISFPAAGRGGHHLRGLWEAAGFRVSDLSGAKRLFIDQWSTSLRYECLLPAGIDSNSLYQGAVELVGYIQVRTRRLRT
jgi:hypothetical protein